MNSSALVEVVIPTYNQADFLRMALQSVIAQDQQNWVATVVNNLSSDHTHKVVHELADSRIRIVDFANHGVIAASRNLAIRDSRADFIAFLDSDDWWRPTKLSTCLSRLDDGVDLVCHAEEWLSDYSSRIVRYGPRHRMEYEAMLLGGNCLSTSAIVGRTQVFQQLDGFSERSDFITAEDYDLWLRVARSGHRIALIDDVLGTFRIHAASASSSIARNSAAEMAVVHEHLKTSSLGARTQRRRLGLSHYSAARAYQKSGDRASARREFALAWRRAPLFPRIYAGALTLTLDSLRRFSRSGAAR
ncbi:MAG: glycosyltransferase family 2 protein [Actinomycetota bacterium]